MKQTITAYALYYLAYGTSFLDTQILASLFNNQVLIRYRKSVIVSLVGLENGVGQEVPQTIRG